MKALSFIFGLFIFLLPGLFFIIVGAASTRKGDWWRKETAKLNWNFLDENLELITVILGSILFLIGLVLLISAFRTEAAAPVAVKRRKHRGKAGNVKIRGQVRELRKGPKGGMYYEWGGRKVYVKK